MEVVISSSTDPVMLHFRSCCTGGLDRLRLFSAIVRRVIVVLCFSIFFGGCARLFSLRLPGVVAFLSCGWTARENAVVHSASPAADSREAAQKLASTLHSWRVSGLLGTVGAN